MSDQANLIPEAPQVNPRAEKQKRLLHSILAKIYATPLGAGEHLVRLTDDEDDKLRELLEREVGCCPGDALWEETQQLRIARHARRLEAQHGATYDRCAECGGPATPQKPLRWYDCGDGDWTVPIASHQTCVEKAIQEHQTWFEMPGDRKEGSS